jgi:hypothetical protein
MFSCRKALCACPVLVAAAFAVALWNRPSAAQPPSQETTPKTDAQPAALEPVSHHAFGSLLGVRPAEGERIPTMKGGIGFEFPIQARVGVSPAGTAGGHSFALAFEVKSAQGKRVTQGFSSVTLAPGMAVDLGTWGHHEESAPGEYELTVILTVMTPETKSFDLARHTSKYVVYTESEPPAEQTGALPAGPAPVNPYDLFGGPQTPQGSGFRGYQFSFSPRASFGGVGAISPRPNVTASARAAPSRPGVVVQPQLTPVRPAAPAPAPAVMFPRVPPNPLAPSGAIPGFGGPVVNSNLGIQGGQPNSGFYVGTPATAQPGPAVNATVTTAGGKSPGPNKLGWHGVNKKGLEEHAFGRGIRGEAGETFEAVEGSFQAKVGLAFEQLALDLLGLDKNANPYPGYERFGLGKGFAVVPDAVGPSSGFERVIDPVTQKLSIIPIWVPDAVFYEFKATSDTIGWRYKDGQIAGYVDVLSENIACYAHDIVPSLWLITPEGAKIGDDLIREANKRNVLLLQVTLEELGGGGRDGSNLRFGSPRPINKQVLGDIHYIPQPPTKPGRLPLK